MSEMTPMEESILKTIRSAIASLREKAEGEVIIKRFPEYPFNCVPRCLEELANKEADEANLGSEREREQFIREVILRHWRPS